MVAAVEIDVALDLADIGLLGTTATVFEVHGTLAASSREAQA
jgi:hypothetical protein